MNPNSSLGWRVLLVVGGILYIGGASQHPQGLMVHMLADPVWVPAHATIVVALLVLMAGFVLFRRTERLSGSLRLWLSLVIVTTALEAVEMAVHTAAYVDAAALASGESTPVLTTHLWLATLIYPVYGLTMVGLIWVGQREHSLGSSWIAWIGLIGAVSHGIVMTLVFRFEWAPLLFPVAALSLSLWFILAGVWPLRRSRLSPMADRQGLTQDH